MTSRIRLTQNNFILVLLFLFSVTIRLPFIQATVDDAFITFRYARNIIAGVGFVYNAGEAVLGTTTPLYTLLLAFFGSFGLDIIVLAKLSNILADSTTTILIYHLIPLGSRGLNWLIAFLFAVSPTNIFYSATGMETGLYTGLVILTMFFYLRNRWLAMAVSAGLLILVRLDGALVVAAIAIAWLLDGKRTRDGLMALLVLVLLQIPWVLFSFWYFGSPIPNSVIAKSLSYRAPTYWQWLVNFWQLYFSRGGWVGGTLITALFFAGVVSVFKTRRKFLLPLIWFMVYVSVFTLTRAGPYGWYYAPLMPIFFALICLGGYEIYQMASATPRLARVISDLPRRALIITLIPALLLVIVLSLYNVWEIEKDESTFEQQVSRPLGLWIRDHSRVDATVSLESIGAIGWYSDRYILDEGGLVSKQVLPLNERTPGEINVIRILQTFSPDYYIAWQTWELETRFSDPASQIWLEDHYSETARYTDGAKTWVLFVSRKPQR